MSSSLFVKKKKNYNGSVAAEVDKINNCDTTTNSNYYTTMNKKDFLLPVGVFKDGVFVDACSPILY